MNDVNIRRTGIEAHSSLGIGERYHSPLRNTYTKLKTDHPKATRSLLLRMAIKAMNDTLGPEGIVPSALVFGEFPSIRPFFGPPKYRPTPVERAEIAHKARKIMSQELADKKVRRA